MRRSDESADVVGESAGTGDAETARPPSDLPGILRTFVLPSAALAIVFFVAFFFRLGSHGLFDPDEPRYAGSALEMMDAGAYGVPRFNGEIRIVKPVLPYWFIIASYRMLGTNELAARLPSAVFGALTALLTAWVAWRFLGRRAAWLTAMILATSPLHVLVSRLAIPDPGLTLLVTCVHAAFLVDYSGGGRSRSARAVLYTAAALGFLVKGPVAVILPALTILVFLVLRRDLGHVRRMGAAWGIPLFLAIALPWYLWVAATEAGGSSVFLRETVSRYLGWEDFHGRPLPYLFGVVAAGYFPWSLHAVSGLVTGRRRTDGWIGTYLAVWIFTGLVFLSLSPNKQPSYVLPLGPAVALLAAREFDRRLSLRAPDRKERWTGWLEALLLLAAAAVGASMLVAQYPDLEAGAVFLGGIVALGSIAVAPIVPIRSRVRFALRVAAMVVLFAWAAGFLAPRVEADRSSKVYEGALIPRIRSADLLVESWFHRPGLVFYARHPVVRLDSVEAIVSNFRKEGRMYCLLEEKNFRRVVERLGEEPEILFRSRGEVLFCDRVP